MAKKLNNNCKLSVYVWFMNKTALTRIRPDTLKDLEKVKAEKVKREKRKIDNPDLLHIIVRFFIENGGK